MIFHFIYQEKLSFSNIWFTKRVHISTQFPAGIAEAKGGQAAHLLKITNNIYSAINTCVHVYAHKNNISYDILLFFFPKY